MLMSDFQYITYITKLKKANISLHHWLVSFILRKEAAFDKHEGTIFQKENVSVVIKRLCVYACMYSF